ncbi:hypothetical protein DY000_02039909 [Brassica cretica]|uniref:Uncharacterized protein n=1 Tax=Brassica cretica TaxID=69181 RepID=A0ABQ7BAD2_BRACR|nr:hypothetical protein DY000_02039909 [Brassica cretica]
MFQSNFTQFRAISNKNPIWKEKGSDGVIRFSTSGHSHEKNGVLIPKLQPINTGLLLEESFFNASQECPLSQHLFLCLKGLSRWVIQRLDLHNFKQLLKSQIGQIRCSTSTLNPCNLNNKGKRKVGCEKVEEFERLSSGRGEGVRKCKETGCVVREFMGEEGGDAVREGFPSCHSALLYFLVWNRARRNA